MIHLIENGQIIDEVIKSDKLVLIDFFATWCTPCQMMSDVLHDIEKDFSDKVEVFKVDVDENQDATIRYGITTMPTLVFFKDGEEVERQIGFIGTEEIKNIIEDLTKNFE